MVAFSLQRLKMEDLLYEKCQRYLIMIKCKNGRNERVDRTQRLFCQNKKIINFIPSQWGYLNMVDIKEELLEGPTAMEQTAFM